MRPGFIGSLVRGGCAAAIFWMSSTAWAANSLTTPEATISPGQSFVATLSLDSFVGLAAVDITFEFNNAQLEFQSVELAPGVPEPFLPPYFDPSTGKVSFFYLSPLDTGSGPLLRGMFKALDSAQGSASISALFKNEAPDGIVASVNVTPLTVAIVPEPSSTALMIAGLGLLLATSRRLFSGHDARRPTLRLGEHVSRGGGPTGFVLQYGTTTDLHRND
jgi:hypothetical protein